MSEVNDGVPNIYEAPIFKVLVSEVRRMIRRGVLDRLFNRAKDSMKVLKKPCDAEERYECKIYLLLGYVMDEVMEVERHKEPLKYVEHIDNLSEFRLPTLLNLLKNNYSSKCLIAQAIFETDEIAKGEAQKGGTEEKVQNQMASKKPQESHVAVDLSHTEESIYEVIENYSMEDNRNGLYAIIDEDDTEGELTETPTLTCMPIYNDYLRLVGSSTKND